MTLFALFGLIGLVPFALAGATHPNPQLCSQPTARTKNGTITGLHSAEYNQDFFLGIPFAQPPVGDLRFANPQSIDSTYSTVLNATQYAPFCVGYGSDSDGMPQSEDCLYLNVVRPAGIKKDELLPVVVWIYGGGFIMGGTSDPRYNLSYVVQNAVDIGKPFIAVSIAYRLSAWGFLQSDEVVKSGNSNFGFRDQRLALQWIQENIKHFKGDKTKVTIWGQSAGSFSVGLHITAFDGRDDGLFRAGIMESGSPINYGNFQNETWYQPYYDAVVSGAGCSSADDTLDCLRTADFSTLNSSIAQVNAGVPSDVLIWQPQIDGDIIARRTTLQLGDSSFVKVPIIIGANTDEGTAFSPYPMNTEADFAKAIAVLHNSVQLPSDLVSGVLDAYPDNNTEYQIPSDARLNGSTVPSFIGTNEWRRSAAYYGDALFIANRRATSQVWAGNSLAAYSYRFNTINAGIPNFVGVTHFEEVAFTFEDFSGAGYKTNPYSGKPQSYEQLATLMASAWASFVVDLDPNSFRDGSEASAPWEAYSNYKPQNYVFDAEEADLAYNEPDTFREVGIQFVQDNAEAYNR